MSINDIENFRKYYEFELKVLQRYDENIHFYTTGEYDYIFHRKRELNRILTYLNEIEEEDTRKRKEYYDNESRKSLEKMRETLMAIIYTLIEDDEHRI